MKDMSIGTLLTYAERNQKRIYRSIEKHNRYESNKEKIKTVGDLIFSNHITLFKMENMGKKSINDLCNALRRAAADLGVLSPEQLNHTSKIEYLWSHLRESLKDDTSEIMQIVTKLKHDINENKFDYLRVAKQLQAMIERYDELIQSQNQQTTLDQFAMAALPVAHQQIQELPVDRLAELIGAKNTLRIDGDGVRKAVAMTAYMMAEAMQAESAKRQGGEA